MFVVDHETHLVGVIMSDCGLCECLFMQTTKVDPFDFAVQVAVMIRFLTNIIDDKKVDPMLMGSAILYRRQLKQFLNGVPITDSNPSNDGASWE